MKFHPHSENSKILQILIQTIREEASDS